MYESITYEELKSLPRDQKVEALKELKALYPTQKKIAEKLGVNPANIYNMIAKYVKADDEEQPKAEAKAVRKSKAVRKAEAKGEAQSKAETKVKAEAKVVRKTAMPAGAITEAEPSQSKSEAELPQNLGEAESSQGRSGAEMDAYTGAKMAGDAAKPVEAIAVPQAAAIGQEKTRAKRMREKKVKREENLMLTLSKSLTGEEAQVLFAGIGSIFLKNHDYRLDIKISER